MKKYALALFPLIILSIFILNSCDSANKNNSGLGETGISLEEFQQIDLGLTLGRC